MAIRNIGDASMLDSTNDNENRKVMSETAETSSVNKHSPKNSNIDNNSSSQTTYSQKKPPTPERIGTALAQAKVRQESAGNYNNTFSSHQSQSPVSFQTQPSASRSQQDNNQNNQHPIQHTNIFSNNNPNQTNHHSPANIGVASSHQPINQPHPSVVATSSAPISVSSTPTQKGMSAPQKSTHPEVSADEDVADNNGNLVAGIAVSAITGTFGLGVDLTKTKYYKPEKPKDNQHPPSSSSSPSPASPPLPNQTTPPDEVPLTNDNSSQNQLAPTQANKNDKQLQRTKTRTAADIAKRLTLENNFLIAGGSTLLYGWNPDGDAVRGERETKLLTALPLATLALVNSKAYVNSRGEKINNKIIKDNNLLRSTHLITNGRSYAGIQDADIIKKQFEKYSPENLRTYTKVNFNSFHSTKKYIKALDEIGAKMKLGENLSKLSDAELEKLYANPNLSAEKAAIVNEIYNLKHIKDIQGTALIEKMKSHGVDVKLTKIDLNNAQSIRIALNNYSSMFLKAGTEDYTKMSISALKSKLKKPEYKMDEDVIKTIISLKKQERVVGKPKVSARNVGMKAYMIFNKVMGSSDVVQGAKQAAQIATVTKAALAVANVTRKIAGKTLLATSKFLYKKAGIQKLVLKSEKGRKIEGFAKNTKSKVDNLKATGKDKITGIQTKKINVKNTIKDKIKNTKVVKLVTKYANKVPGAKLAGNAIKKTASFLGAFADILRKIKFYVIIGVAVAFLLVALINGITGAVENNSTISQLGTIQGNSDTGEMTKTDDVNLSLFTEIYKNLINADNKWYEDKESIKAEKKTSSVVGDPHFKLDEGVNSNSIIIDTTSLQGYWNPNKGEVYKLDKFGSDDPTLQDGVYIYYNDGDESAVNKHSNVKMCMSLAHGLIQTDYEHFSEHFAEICYGLWDNSRDFTYKLVTKNSSSTNANRYLYSCNVCDETFKYVCIADEAISNSSKAVNSSVPADKKLVVIDADNNTKKTGGEYDATYLISKENGCIKTTHENNGSKNYTETDLINSESSSHNSFSTSKIDAFNHFTSIKSSSTATAQEKALAEEALNSIYLEKFGYTGPAGLIKYEGSDTYMEKFLDDISINSNCDNYTVVKTGTKKIFCSDYTIKKTELGASIYPIAGCTELLNGKHADNDKNCISSNTTTENHGTRRLLAPDGCLSFTTYFIYEDVEIIPGISISTPILYYECKGHTTKICDGKCPNGFTCYGHDVPTYMAVCNSHYRCDGHTAVLCTGHMDLDIAASIIGLDEDDNLYATEAWTTDGKINDGSWFFKPEYRPFATIVDEIFNNHDESGNVIITDKVGNAVPDYNYYVDTSGNRHKIWDGTKLHWTAEMKEYVNALLSTDWDKLYGVGAESDKLETDIVMNTSEINKIIAEYYPQNKTLYAEKVKDGLGVYQDSPYKLEYDARYQILNRALYGITRIPFYPGGKASAYELGDNNFGALLRNEAGVIQEGKYTAPDGTECTFSYKGLDWNGFILWATSTGDPINTDINTLITGSGISFANATPGDIYVAGEERGIYLGRKIDEADGIEKAFLIRFNVPSKDDASVKLSIFSEPISSVEFYSFYKTY